jgi:NADP-dependent 3-hydroxy acid dehydrogenase YdfG
MSSSVQAAKSEVRFEGATPTRAKTVVVTGASAGVGRAIAKAFGARGDRVALLARGRAGLEGAVRDVKRSGGKGLPLQVDVADAAAVDAAADRIEAELGPVDVWINSAMVSVFSPVKKMKADEYRRVTDVTYHGVVYGTLAALRYMLPRDRGHIIQIGSALAYRGIPLQSAYCGAKHAIQGFCDSLRSELLHDGSGVKLTMIQLPAVNTPQFGWVRSRLPNKAQPVPPIYQPEVVADAVVWLTEHPQRELFLGYSAAKAIIGNKIAPAYADRVLARMGYSSQQTDEPRDPQRPDNLWEPQDDDVDHGAHGVFDSRARAYSPLFWAEKHHVFCAAGAALLLAGAALGCLAAGGRRRE